MSGVLSENAQIVLLLSMLAYSLSNPLAMGRCCRESLAEQEALLREAELALAQSDAAMAAAASRYSKTLAKYLLSVCLLAIVHLYAINVTAALPLPRSRLPRKYSATSITCQPSLPDVQSTSVLPAGWRRIARLWQLT